MRNHPKALRGQSNSVQICHSDKHRSPKSPGNASYTCHSAAGPASKTGTQTEAANMGAGAALVYRGQHRLPTINRHITAKWAGMRWATEYLGAGEGGWGQGPSLGRRAALQEQVLQNLQHTNQMRPQAVNNRQDHPDQIQLSENEGAPLDNLGI